MAVISLKTLGAAMVTHATAMVAESSGTITAAQMAAAGRMLQVMDNDKNLAPILKLSATDQANISTTS